MTAARFDLWVSGAGDLGLRVAQLYREAAPTASIACETRSVERHALFKELGFAPRRSEQGSATCDSLVICFPPSTPNYVAEVSRVLSYWTQRGAAILVSSSGVYQEGLQGDVFEEAPRKANSLLVEAEDKAVLAGAHVVRLAGLYSEDRGPHIFWQSLGEHKSHPDTWINLLYRNDAARALVKLLFYQGPAEAWNLSDETPLSRKVIASAWAQKKGLRAAKFLGLESKSPDKTIRSQKFFKKFSWSPQIKSFLDFIEST